MASSGQDTQSAVLPAINQSKARLSRREQNDSHQPNDEPTDHPNSALALVRETTKMTIAVDPVALVTTECISVTSAMRKNARWAQSSVSAILGGSGIGENSLEALHPPRAFKRRSDRHADALATNGEHGPTNRWGLCGKRGKSLQDTPLMSAFSRLRSELRECTDVWAFDTPTLLHPFLQVIRSSSTSALITSLALVAITRFFAYDLIISSSPRLPLGMQLLSAAVTHCRFEASDSAADEIVLLRILKLMENMLSGPGGILLSDESVCEMMETGLSMCCQGRLSELLRRSAEMTMLSMCQIVFQRLKQLESETNGNTTTFEANCRDAGGDRLRMDAPLKGLNAATPHPEASLLPPGTLDLPHSTAPVESSAPRVLDDSRGSGQARMSSDQGDVVKLDSAPGTSEQALGLAEETAVPSEETQIKPYSLPSIRELFRVLVNLLDPHDRQHTDTMRIMALRIIDVALEVAGPSISKHPSLAALAKDSLCRHLFQLVRSENISLLHQSLRVAGTLLETCRGVLKLQQELFLSYLVTCLHPRIDIPYEEGIDPSLYEGVPHAPKAGKPPLSSTSSGRSTPVPVRDRQKLGLEGGARKPDAREAMIESIGALARIPYFVPELFINYDCEVDRGDLCEDFIGLLARNAFPDSATWSTTNVPPLCLDALLGYIHFVAERLDDEPSNVGLPDKEKLLRQRALKKIIIKGTAKFNESPKGGIAYLASQGIIENPNDPASVARFLKGTTRISKKVLGEYLSKKANEPLLGAFIDLFDFTQKRVDEALRDLLGAFRLPGESPLIERIVTVFSDKYCAKSTPEGVADRDAVFVLTYAIIMLNTDQHNANVKSANRMTFAAFAKNLRGVNGGSDFEQSYLQEIFDTIQTNEIILPDEHDNKHAFDYAWQELLTKAQKSCDLVLCRSSDFDAEMFEATWSPVVATLSYVFMSASEDAVYHRVITGFHHCARIAARYGITPCLDRIVRCLGTISTIAAPDHSNTSLNTEVKSDHGTIMVSELAVRFGRDYKAQLATVILFRGVIAGNEACIVGGWKEVAQILRNLFVNSLQLSLFPDSKSLLGIDPIPVRSPSQVINREERANGSGIFQSFTSYLTSYAADDPPEPSEDEVNDTLCTYDCIGACPIREIFDSLLSLPSTPLANLVTKLLAHVPSEATPVVAKVKSDVTVHGFNKPNSRQVAALPVYDPSLVYTLELLTILATKNKHATSSIEKDIVETLYGVVRNSSAHPITVSRAVFYLLKVLHAKHGSPNLRTPVILHRISSLDTSVMQAAALPILKGLSDCLESPTPLRSEILSTPDFWSTLREAHAIAEAAEGTFQLLVAVVEDFRLSITADNYEAVISLLQDVATAGKEGAKAELQLDRGGKRSKSGRNPSARLVESSNFIATICLSQLGITRRSNVDYEQ